jgi:hypothetical protein
LIGAETLGDPDCLEHRRPLERRFAVTRWRSGTDSNPRYAYNQMSAYFAAHAVLRSLREEPEALFSLVHRVFLVAPLADEEAGLADSSLECFGPLNFGRDRTTKENNLSISRKAASVRFRSPVASKSR